MYVYKMGWTGYAVVGYLLLILLASLVVFDKACVSSTETGTESVSTDSEPDSSQDSALVFVKDVEQTASDDDDGIVQVEEDSNIEELSDEPFVATDEWQIVKKGQKLPPGLHVEMDFQTGQRRAKLMKNKKKDYQSTSTKKKDHVKTWDAGNEGIINTEKQRFSKEQLKKVLMDFKYKDLTPAEDKTDDKKKFRKYEDLKEEMKKLRMSVKTEGEIVTELYSRLKKPGIQTDEIITALTDLEYYLHQIDNAQNFADQGGLGVLSTLMNTSEADIRAEAAHTLGAALQSNAKVQVAALDSGVMQQLIRTLSLDASFLVRRKCLFALSTLIRQFPYAQKKFIESGGLSALSDLFAAAKDEKVKIKIVTLLTDLLHEYDSNMNLSTADDPVQVERSKQYEQVELRKQLSSSGWCSLVISLLQDQLSGHDVVDKLVTAMTALTQTCRRHFIPAAPQLQSLMSQYRQLAQEEQQEGQDDFFSSVYDSLQKLVSQISRDEL